MKYLRFLLFLFLSISLQAQQSQKYLIKAGKLFDSESGQFKTGLSILVNANKIEAVKPDKEVSETEKKEYVLIDLSNYTVLPGLIDAHTHLLYKEVLHPGNEFAGMDLAKLLTMEGDSYRAIYGAARAKAYLEAGITSVQDLGNSGQFGDIALRKAINEGLVPGPRMRCAGQGLSTEGGQLPGLIYKHRSLVNDEYRIVTGAEDAIQAVRENVTQGADVIKIYANNTPNVTRLSVAEIKAIVQEAHRYGIRVTAHATDNRAVYDAVIGGGIEHGYQIDDTTLTLMAKRGVMLVPTYLDSVTCMQWGKLAYPDDKNFAANLMAYQKASGEQLQRAIKRGVTIAAGSDDYIDFKLPFAEPSKRALISYYELGTTIPQVLQFATINASKQLNWSDYIGRLKAGYLADIIAVDSDLDRNIQALLNTRFVMKSGKVYLGQAGLQK
ncbi:MAG: amidohydrolase [Flaviaesturariibacter sp.]|nr:amidohydrolase [Flaviaesturariibacter sp.]